MRVSSFVRACVRVRGDGHVQVGFQTTCEASGRVEPVIGEQRSLLEEPSTLNPRPSTLNSKSVQVGITVTRATVAGCLASM